MKRKLLYTLLISLLSFSGLQAQFYNGSQLNFGKNRVQHDVDRFWTFFRYDAFDAYYYLGGKELAIYTARYAMEQIEEIEDKLDYTLEEKVQFIIFNSLSDLKESNIGLLSNEQYNIGGVTYIVGTKVFLYFDGNYENLERQIRTGLAEVILNEMLYGSDIPNQVKNSALINLPDWFTQGLISFLADEWDITTDEYVRDGILSGKYIEFNTLTGEDAVYAGHSIWKFISDKYGTPSVSNIAYMTKVSRNVENGFLFVVGVSFKNLMQDWERYYTNEYFQFDSMREIPEGEELDIKIKKDMVVQRLKISPDGKYVAYVTNQLGKFKLMLYDVETGKKKKLIRRGHKLDEKVDNSYPLLAWHPTGKLLAFLVEDRGYTWIYYYNVDDNELIKEKFIDFQKITDFSFNPKGDLLVMSAVLRGQSDIFVYNRSSRTYENITKDVYDDLNPCFIKGGKWIVFSSNRPNDTVRFDLRTARVDTHKVIDKQAAFDLFVYDYQTRSELLRRVTSTPYFNETNPRAYDNGYITFLSDQNGIVNRYVGRFDSTIAYVDTTTHYRYFSETYPVTNYSRSVVEYDINHKARRSGMIFKHNGKYKMVFNPLILAEKAESRSLVNTTYRQQQIAERMRLEREALEKPKEETPKVEPKKKTTKTKTRFVTVRKSNQVKKDTAEVDIDNYEIGDPSEKADSLIENIIAGPRSNFYIPKERVYDVEFSINQLISQVDFNYINSSYQQFTGGGSPIFINPGLNAFLKVGVTDLLEDYRLTGGVRLSATLTNNEYFLSWENLKNRWDKQVILHRKSLEFFDEYSLIRRYSHEGHYILKYPFSNVLSIRNSAILRVDRDVYMSSDLYNLLQDDKYDLWASLKSELVFDNTRQRGLNSYFGTRFKIFAEYYQQADKLDQNMVVVGGDFRHYMQIHKEIIWANRFAASTSFGNNKLIYYMGGVDNWLLPRFNTDINIDQTQNYKYQTLATNMRGFTQNIRNGNSFALINSEIRVPVFRYFINKPLRSNFLNNFQVIGFGDIGTAWTGSSPYSEENSLYTQILEQGPVKMTVKRQVEPIVGGFGFGLRTTVLGYFVRADWAWGVEDGEIHPSVFYLSLSLDF